MTLLQNELTVARGGAKLTNVVTQQFYEAIARRGSCCTWLIGAERREETRLALSYLTCTSNEISRPIGSFRAYPDTIASGDPRPCSSNRWNNQRESKQKRTVLQWWWQKNRPPQLSELKSLKAPNRSMSVDSSSGTRVPPAKSVSRLTGKTAQASRITQLRRTHEKTIQKPVVSSSQRRKKLGTRWGDVACTRFYIGRDIKQKAPFAHLKIIEEGCAHTAYRKKLTSIAARANFQ